MKNILLILLLTCMVALAQPATVTTNVVTAHPAFRIVNGQLYNTELSTNFATLEGRCIAVLSNGVVAQRIEIQTYQETATNAAQVTLAITGTPAPVIKTEYVPGKKFFIRNYPDQPLVEIGSSVIVRAMRDGIFSHESEVMELWDCGTLNQVAVVTTNGVSTNALKSGIISR